MDADLIESCEVDQMSLVARIDIDIYALIICALMLFGIYNRIEMHFLQNKFYIALLLADMALLALDAISRIYDGRPGQASAIIYTAINVLFFALHPVTSFLGALYINYQVFHDERQLKKILHPFLIPMVACVGLSLMTPFNGLIFYLDKENFYHRGPMFYYFMLACYLYLFYNIVLVLSHRSLLKKRHIVPLLLFSLPPILGGILQAVFYGVSFIWPGMTLSLLIVYNSIQNQQLNTDYLTGLYNRMQFDQYFRDMIHRSGKQKAFSAIFIDIDNFKEINDRYGHIMGDRALEIMAELLRKSLRKDDFIARFGGDEFVAVMDAQEHDDLEKSIQRIRESIDDYNQTPDAPFELSVSIGYDVYDGSSGMDEEEFFKHLDSLMYEDKSYNKGKQAVGDSLKSSGANGG